MAETMIVDFLASERHFADHLAPIWLALPEEARGSFFIPSNLEAHVRGLGLEPTCWRAKVNLINALQAAGVTSGPVVSTAYRDLKITELAGRRSVFCEHGAGQTYCLAPQTRVLTADLHWIPIGELVVGQELIGFDEESDEFMKNGRKGRRAWRQSYILETSIVRLPCYRLLFEDGTEIVASSEHKWLKRCGDRNTWMTTRELQPADRYPQRSTKVVKCFDTWDEDRSWGAGYLAASFDGEGCLCQTDRDDRQSRMMLSMSQRDNAMLMTVEDELTKRGFSFKTRLSSDKQNVYGLHIKGGTRETLRFLGSIRPRRLLENYRPLQNGQMRGRTVALLRSEFVGYQSVVALRTSTKTFFAEGFASHNSNRHTSYAGGDSRGPVSLFLCPGPYAAQANRQHYPDIPCIEVGCPKLDNWHQRPRKTPGEKPVVAISFHWPCKVSPEAGTAWDDFRPVLPELNRDPRWHLIGHAHPRWAEKIRPQYEALGIEWAHDFEEICERADLYVIDNSSTIFEFASLDRPVLLMNSRHYRRSVEHGLRFWSEAQIGLNCSAPNMLVEQVAQALRDPLEQRDLRRRSVHRVYSHTDGRCAERAAAAILKMEVTEMSKPIGGVALRALRDLSGSYGDVRAGQIFYAGCRRVPGPLPTFVRLEWINGRHLAQQLVKKGWAAYYTAPVADPIAQAPAIIPESPPGPAPLQEVPLDQAKEEAKMMHGGTENKLAPAPEENKLLEAAPGIPISGLYCEACGLTFANRGGLMGHQRGQAHKDKVAELAGRA